jgi:hypothetical protein
MTNTVVIGGIEYIPKPDAEPAWNNGVVAGNFLDQHMPVLLWEPTEWTSDFKNVCQRQAAMRTAFAALKWYRDEVVRLTELVKP